MTSFTLHAPLELLARTALLSYVEDDARAASRDRLARLGHAYSEAGEEVGEPGARAYDDLAYRGRTPAGRGRRRRASTTPTRPRRGWPSGPRPSSSPLALADDVIPRLSAAGHGSILLYLLPAWRPRSRAAARPLRGLVRELARHPDWGLTWHRDRTRPAETEGGDLITALRSPRLPRRPGQ